MAEQRSTLIIEISSEQAARNARALDRELQSIERTGNYATTSMNSMSVAARQLAGYLAGVVTVGTAIAKMDDWTNLNNRLRLVTSSQKALNVAMQDTFDIAQRSGAAWGGTATIYQKIQYNSEKLGLSQEKVAKITESISKSISNSGSSAQAASAALYQLGQSFDKSSLNGDEFVSMSENAGYLMEVFAKGLGVTRAELKEMSSQGLLTTDKMVQAIEKMSGSIEEDFGKTNFTIGQSFTQLSNSVTKFVGEAGQGSGAASTLSSSIKLLADNFGSIANIAVLGGVALLTKTIINQTLSVKASIAASIQRRAALTAELESQVRLTGLEVQRTRQVAALALTEVNLARQEYNNATTRTARAAATIRLTQAEIAHNLALNQSTVAIGANTSAQNALNASRALGARALALVGGPIGAITIGVTALAAGYMYMSGKAAEANKKLEEQAEVAKKAKEELLALKGLEKDDAIDKMTAAFQRQNEALTESSSKVNMQLNAIEQLYKGNKDVVKVVQDARNGTISMNEAVQRFNELRISKEVYNSIKANTVEFAKNATEANNSKYKMSLFGIEVELAGRKAQTGALGVDENSKSLDKNKTAAQKAADAQRKFKESLFERDFEAKLTRNLLAKGYQPEQAKNMVETANWAKKNGVSISNELYQIGLQTLSIEEQNNKTIEARNKKEKESTKEAEKKFKYTQSELLMLQKIANLSAKADLDGISAKYGIPKNYLAGLMAQESKGDPNAVSPTGAIGYFQTTSDYRKDNGISVADSKNLPVIANVVARNLAKAYKELGSWESAIRSHNAGVGGSRQFDKIGRVSGSNERNKEVANFVPSVNKWIVGLGGSGLKANGTSDTMGDLKDYLNFVKQQAESRKSLELNVSNEVTKIHESLKDKLIEIDKAGFTPERTAEIKAKHQARADNEIAITEYTLKSKLEEYSAFKKTDEQLLKDSFDQKKFYASRDIELSKEQRTQAVALIDEQYKYEVEKSKLAKEQRLLQSKEFYMSELQMAKAKYDIERRLLDQSNEDPKEKAFKSQMLALQNHVDMNRRLKDASTGWDTIQAQMNGSTGRFQVSQDKFSRMGASQNLFDTQIADVESQEQEPGADLQKLAEVREQIWAAHNQRMIDIENQYQMDSLNLQLTQAQQLTGSFANMFKGILGESSGAYKTMFAMQQGFALTQAGMNLWSSVSDAYAKEPGTVWQKVAAGAKAALDQGTFLAMIQAVTPQGFATGGHITGKGTGTSDDIPIMASNGEFMLKAAAVSKLGLAALNYMNQTGEIPFQSEYLGMKSQYLGSAQPDLNVQKFKDGGLVGVTRISNEDADRRRFNSIPKNSSQGECSGDIKIEVNITDSGVNTSGGNTQDQRQFAQVVGNAVRAVIIQEKRQGGLLSK